MPRDELDKTAIEEWAEYFAEGGKPINVGRILDEQAARREASAIVSTKPVKDIREKLALMELREKECAELFLQECHKYSHYTDLSMEALPVEAKASLLKDYSEFTKITNPDYSDYCKINPVYIQDTFRRLLTAANRFTRQ